MRLKRVYEEAEKSDGFRILVDRLWPRGISKEKAHIDMWLRDIAPSHELRHWFGHDPAKWKEFQERYKAELESKQEEIVEFQKIIEEEQVVTLLFSASDEKHNNAVALTKILSL